jgi:hypothetical protein
MSTGRAGTLSGIGWHVWTARHERESQCGSTVFPLATSAIANRCAKECPNSGDWGPGYRVYYTMLGKESVLLLCGGDKRKQPSDIMRAITHLKDYKERTRR